MKVFIFTLLILLFGTSIVWLGENIFKTNKQSKKVEEIIYVDTSIPKVPKYNNGPLVSSINWTIDNMDKVGIGENGEWSLTGWSKMGVTKDFNPWFLKVGIITGRLGAAREMDCAETENWKQWADWEHREYLRDYGVIIGVHWICFFDVGGEPDKRNDVEKLMDSASFYESLPHLRGRKAALYSYKRLIKKFPNSEQAKKSVERISYLKKRFPELIKENG